MQRREGKVLRLGRAVQLDGDVHQAERDRATPQGSGHCRSSRGIQTKGHEALNNLSSALTLFKVDLRAAGHQRRADCAIDIAEEGQSAPDERSSGRSPS